MPMTNQEFEDLKEEMENGKEALDHLTEAFENLHEVVMKFIINDAFIYDLEDMRNELGKILPEFRNHVNELQQKVLQHSSK